MAQKSLVLKVEVLKVEILEVDVLKIEVPKIKRRSKDTEVRRAFTADVADVLCFQNEDLCSQSLLSIRDAASDELRSPSWRAR